MVLPTCQQDTMPVRNAWTPNSPASSETSPTTRNESQPTANDNPANTTGPRKRPGQTKSRTGCYSCKRRKVKCNEHWPECDNCKRLKLDCVYPWAKKMAGREQQQQSAAAGQPSAPLRTTPGALTMQDLRFYHFFMTTCYPRWPADPIAQRIWGQAAAMSSNVSPLLTAF